MVTSFFSFFSSPNKKKAGTKGPSINDVTALGEGDIKDFVTTVLKP